MIRRFPRVALLVISATFLGFAAPAQAIVVMTYNILNYSGGREADFKIIMNATVPDVIIAQEVISLGGAQAFLNNVLNGAGGPGGYVLCDFGDGADTDNACFIRSATITGGGASDHFWITTSPRRTDRWKLGLVGYTAEASKFWPWSVHLKAGNTASDQTSRANQCSVMRTQANALYNSTSNFFYGGDFNVYASTETAYQNLIGSTADNDGRAFDPINQPGAWTENSAFDSFHTQSPHLNNAGAPGGATGGGMDDRFDFMLISAALNDGEGLAYVPGTYRAYGNDGNHFNMDINDPPTIPEGATIANALHAAADHIPVIMTLQVPAKVDSESSLDFGRVVTGGMQSRTLTVTNTAVAPADELTYTLSAPVGFTAPGGSLTENAGGGSNMHTIDMNIGAVGAVAATLMINSDDVDQPVRNVSLVGTVVRHAVPSLTSPAQTLSGTLDFGDHPPGGFSPQNVSVHNLGFDALQALLEVYDFMITSDPQNRFSLPGFAPASAGGSPASVSVDFDESGLALFTPYSATLTLKTRDEQVPGATNLSDLTITLTAEVTAARGDLNLSGIVEATDIPLFVDVLLGIDTDPLRVELSDVNDDGAPNGEDVAAFVDAL